MKKFLIFLMIIGFVNEGRSSKAKSIDHKQSPDKKIQKEDEARDFDRAQSLFKDGEEEKSLVSLTDFLRRYPQSTLADDAQYMIGTLSFRKRNFAEAIRELKKTLEYRNKAGADHIEGAFLLIAESWYRLGETDKAIIEWEAIVRVFPDTPSADQAQMRLMEVKNRGKNIHEK